MKRQLYHFIIAHNILGWWQFFKKMRIILYLTNISWNVLKIIKIWSSTTESTLIFLFGNLNKNIVKFKTIRQSFLFEIKFIVNCMKCLIDSIIGIVSFLSSIKRFNKLDKNLTSKLLKSVKNVQKPMKI